MIVLIISDIHGNYHALESVTKAVTYDVLLCCGDVVVDYPFPEQCIHAVKDACARICMGNNDYNVAYKQKASDHIGEQYAHLAKDLDRSTELAVDMIGEDGRKYLRGLPRECRFALDGITFYMNHTVPHLPLYHYIDRNTPRSELIAHYRGIRADVMLTGHTHVPYVRNLREKLLVNPGSIGEPRDGDPRASFATFDTATGRAELGRLAYDITETSALLGKLNFPTYSLFCLQHGFLPESAERP